MRLIEHIIASSCLLAIGMIVWGATEILTLFSATDFGNISILSYLSIILFPLALYGIAGLILGALLALLISFIGRPWMKCPLRTGIRFYTLLIFIPLLLAILAIWNTRSLPGIPITAPISLIHSLVILLSVGLIALLSRALIIRILRGGLPIRSALIAGIAAGAALALYAAFNPESSAHIPADAPPPTRDMPNVLLITIDTLRADHLGCYGNSSIQTPSIDRLASEGVLFLNATSQVPLTLPSHTSILTSTYPPIHGVRDNARYRFDRTVPTLAEILKERDYLTSAFIGAFVLDSRFGLGAGFDTYNDEIQNQALYYFFSASPPFVLAGGMKLAGILPPQKPERPADRTTRAAIDWIRENREKRFFLWLHYYDPHGPLNPPSPYDTLYVEPGTDRKEFQRNVERYAAVQSHSDTRDLTRDELEGIRALYRGEVAFSDHWVGILMAELEALEIADRTLVVLTADHGESQAEHNYLGHTVELYQEIMRVPLIFRQTDVLPAGKRVDRFVQSIDIAPTVLGFLGIDIPPTCQGRSLAGMIAGEGDSGPDPWAYLETHHAQKNTDRLIGITCGEYKYIRSLEGDREELYRISTDPREADNLAGGDPERLAAMRKNLLVLLEEMGNEAQSREIPLDRQTVEAMRTLGYIQ